MKRLLFFITLLSLVLSGCGVQPELPTLPPIAIPTFLTFPPTPTPTVFVRPTFDPLKAPITEDSMIAFLDETVPDGTSFKPGESFTKTWTYRNEGPLKWTKGYSFVLVSSNPASVDLSGERLIPFEDNIAPGREVSFTAHFTAPQQDGIYTVLYQIMNDRGELLAGTESWVSIAVGDAIRPVNASSADISVSLKSATLQDQDIAVDFCMELPDASDWYPGYLTLNLCGIEIIPSSSRMVNQSSDAIGKCFQFTFPNTAQAQKWMLFSLYVDRLELRDGEKTSSTIYGPWVLTGTIN